MKTRYIQPNIVKIDVPELMAVIINNASGTNNGFSTEPGGGLGVDNESGGEHSYPNDPTSPVMGDAKRVNPWTDWDEDE